MHNLLNNYPVYFPKNKSLNIYTLQQFLTQANYQLPFIVNITALNTHGRSLKHFLSKNTQLLLISSAQLNSILAEYVHGNDSRLYPYRTLLGVKQGKMASRASVKFRNMRKLSKSLASLTGTAATTTDQFNNSQRDDNDDDDDNNNDDETLYQRNLVKNLNEKRLTSSSNSLCRIPIEYRCFFELLNESGHGATPCRRLIDLLLTTGNNQDVEDRIEKWPHGFYLRSSCQAFTQKIFAESNSTTSNDSCYSSSSDLDVQRSSIILNDDVHMLQAGEMMFIMGECVARHVRSSEKEQPSSPQMSSSPLASPVNWLRDKSKGFFSRKSRSSTTSDNFVVLNEFVRNKSISTKLEPYLKCQNEQGEIFFISLTETGSFSPLNFSNYRSKIDLELSQVDLAEVFQLKNLVSSFRLPISVRHLDGAITFDNPYLPASIHRHEPPTKFRLLMSYTEDIVFACPINIPPSKTTKHSSPSSSCVVFPLSINADIEIQPCINMNEILQTQEFRELMINCSQLIDRYLTHISLVHSPLQLSNPVNRRRQPLYKKRSQSESFLDHSDDESRAKFHHSNEYLHSADESMSSAPSPLRYRDSIETLRQKNSTGKDQTQMRRSGAYAKLKTDRQKRHSQYDYTSEDEIYDDVDKIYDCIRAGDQYGELKRIQAKDNYYYHASSSPHAVIIPSANNRVCSHLSISMTMNLFHFSSL